MSDPGYNRDEANTAEARYQAHKRQRLGAYVLAFFGAIQLTLGIIGCRIEIGLLHRIFSFMEPLPGEQEWSSWLLAATGISFLCAYHVLKRDRPTSVAVRFISHAVSICLPLYGLGMAGALACVVFQNADGILFETATDLTADFFGPATAAPESRSFIESLLPHFTALFAIAIGSFAIINLFAAQRLLELGCENAVTAYERITRFKQARAAIQKFRRCQSRLTELNCHATGLADSLRSLRIIAANEIVGAIHAAATRRIQWIEDQRREPNPLPNRLAPQAPRPSLDAIAKRATQLKSINAKQVLASIDAANL